MFYINEISYMYVWLQHQILSKHYLEGVGIDKKNVEISKILEPHTVDHAITHLCKIKIRVFPTEHCF